MILTKFEYFNRSLLGQLHAAIVDQLVYDASCNPSHQVEYLPVCVNLEGFADSMFKLNEANNIIVVFKVE
jgi:hypothetical protein